MEVLPYFRLALGTTFVFVVLAMLHFQSIESFCHGVDACKEQHKFKDGFAKIWLIPPLFPAAYVFIQSRSYFKTIIFYISVIILVIVSFTFLFAFVLPLFQLLWHGDTGDTGS